MSIYIKQNTIYPILVSVIDNNGNFITTLSVSYEIRKSLDNSLVTSGTLTNVGNIYLDTATLTEKGDYYILYFTPTGYENGEERIVVQEHTNDDLALDLDSLAENLAKVLGLVQSNFRITHQIYNANNCLTSAKIAIYNNAIDTQNQVNPISEYTVIATYDSNSRLTDYKVTEN